jgi:GDP-D-mannose dehydratase
MLFGILFNHGSPRSGWEFVPRKISSAAAKVNPGLAPEVPLERLVGEMVENDLPWYGHSENSF